MRAYINWSMLEGTIVGLPLFAAIGAAFGGVGRLLAPGLTRRVDSLYCLRGADGIG